MRKRQDSLLDADAELVALQARVANGELPGVVEELSTRSDLGLPLQYHLLYWQRHLGDSEGVQTTAQSLLQRDPHDLFVLKILTEMAWVEADYAGAEQLYNTLIHTRQAQQDPAELSNAKAGLEELRAHVQSTLQPARNAQQVLDPLFWLSIFVVLAMVCGSALWATRKSEKPQRRN